MIGTYHILYPNKARELRSFLTEPDTDALSEAVNGLLEPLPYFDHWIDETGLIKPCVVFVNQEAHFLNLLFNFPATAFWHYVARSKGERVTQRLHGTVVIVSGDDEFLEAL